MFNPQLVRDVASTCIGIAIIASVAYQARRSRRLAHRIDHLEDAVVHACADATVRRLHPYRRWSA